jgi:hypothetical protein
VHAVMPMAAAASRAVSASVVNLLVFIGSFLSSRPGAAWPVDTARAATDPNVRRLPRTPWTILGGFLSDSCGARYRRDRDKRCGSERGTGCRDHAQAHRGGSKSLGGSAFRPLAGRSRGAESYRKMCPWGLKAPDLQTLTPTTAIPASAYMRLGKAEVCPSGSSTLLHD